MSIGRVVQFLHELNLPKDDGMIESGYPGLRVPREKQKSKPDGSFVKDPGHDLSEKFKKLKRAPRPYENIDDVLDEQEEAAKGDNGGWYNPTAQE
jgi:hypothetical protein